MIIQPAPNGLREGEMTFKAVGNKIILIDRQGEECDWAFCDKPEEAIKLLDRGHYLNDVKPQYTAAARLFYKAEQLPGFKWIVSL